MPTPPPPHTHTNTKLAGTLALLIAVATVAWASTVKSGNPHYDSTATTGRLEKGCKEFELVTGDRLNTICNKVSPTGITTFHDYTDIASDVDSACHDQWQYIRPKEDSVVVGYKCHSVTKDQILEKDLNDIVWWNPADGTTNLR